MEIHSYSKGGLGVSVFWQAAVNLLVWAIPSHLMAYYPFRDRLRFPLWKVPLPVYPLQTTQSLFYGSAMLAGGDGRAGLLADSVADSGLYHRHRVVLETGFSAPRKVSSTSFIPIDWAVPAFVSG